MSDPAAAVDAVVVSWHGDEELAACIDSCLRARTIRRVIVVDNGGLPDGLPADRLQVVRPGRNLGYGRAANRGLDVSDAAAVLVLNQDCVVNDDAVRLLLEEGRAVGAWLAGPTLVDGGGREAPVKARFPLPLRWEAPPPAGVEGAGFVPWVSGAALMFLPGHTHLRFDERLFMYAEDEELCWRVWDAGGAVVTVPGARVVHHGGTASRRRWSTGAIAARTVANRARMVRWHAGLAGVPRYLFHIAIRRMGHR